MSNDVVVYYDWDDSKMAQYNLVSNTKNLQAVQLVPEVYSASSNTVYTLGSTSVYAYVLGASSYSSVGISYEPYKYNDFVGQRLRGDGGKVVMGASGFESEGTGIYLLDVTVGKGVIKLR